MRGHFTFCAPVELNLVTKVFLFLYRTEALLLAKDNWLNLRYDCTVLLMTGPDRGGPEAADCLDIVRHFSFCTPKKFEFNLEGTFWFDWVEAMVFAKDNWSQRLHEVTVLFMTIPDRGGQEAVDSLDMTGHFVFCTLVELNLITNVPSYEIVLKLWFWPKKIDWNFDPRLLSCQWLSQTAEDRKLLIVLTWKDTSVFALLLRWI